MFGTLYSLHSDKIPFTDQFNFFDNNSTVYRILENWEVTFLCMVILSQNFIGGLCRRIRHLRVFDKQSLDIFLNKDVLTEIKDAVKDVQFGKNDTNKNESNLAQQINSTLNEMGRDQFLREFTKLNLQAQDHLFTKHLAHFPDYEKFKEEIFENQTTAKRPKEIL